MRSVYDEVLQTCQVIILTGILAVMSISERNIIRAIKENRDIMHTTVYESETEPIQWHTSLLDSMQHKTIKSSDYVPTEAKPDSAYENEDGIVSYFAPNESGRMVLYTLTKEDYYNIIFKRDVVMYQPIRSHR